MPCSFQFGFPSGLLKFHISNYVKSASVALALSTEPIKLSNMVEIYMMGPQETA